MQIILGLLTGAELLNPFPAGKQLHRDAFHPMQRTPAGVFSGSRSPDGSKNQMIEKIRESEGRTGQGMNQSDELKNRMNQRIDRSDGSENQIIR